MHRRGATCDAAQSASDDGSCIESEPRYTMPVHSPEKSYGTASCCQSERSAGSRSDADTYSSDASGNAVQCVTSWQVEGCFPPVPSSKQSARARWSQQGHVAGERRSMRPRCRPGPAAPAKGGAGTTGIQDDELQQVLHNLKRLHQRVKVGIALQPCVTLLLV